ncbi:MAG: hypothetical protein ACRET2_10710 [Steroidobacteraceae bacterium]
MLTLNAARRIWLRGCAAALASLPLLCAAAAPPATALSPDQRPTLVIVAMASPLLIAHHPHPLSDAAAEQLALKIGLQAAVPIIRRDARQGLDPLPDAWKSGEPDRGFTAALAAALERPQANWPWRDLRIVQSQADVRDAISELTGQDVAIATIKCELEDWMHTVQYSAVAHVRLLRAVGTPHESRTQFTIRHLSKRLTADWGDARQYAAVFKADGPLDHVVGAAALDLSRVLAVTIARLTTATPDVQIAGRRFSALPEKPDCSACEPSDPVLHTEPGRVWVAPSKLAGTVLSLPVPRDPDQQVASDPPPRRTPPVRAARSP